MLRRVSCPAPCRACSWSEASTMSKRSRMASSKSRRPSGRMSTSMPWRIVIPGKRSRSASISSRWRAMSSRASVRDAAAPDEWSVMAMYLVPERMAALDHRLEVVAAIAVGRVHVQVAADVRRVDERRKIACRRGIGLATAVPELGRDERQPEARVECVLACVQAIAPAPRVPSHPGEHPSQWPGRESSRSSSGAAIEDLDRRVSERADDLAPLGALTRREDASGRAAISIAAAGSSAAATSTTEDTSASTRRMSPAGSSGLELRGRRLRWRGRTRRGGPRRVRV